MSVLAHFTVKTDVTGDSMKGVSLEYSVLNFYKENGFFAVRAPKSGVNTFDVLGFSDNRIDVIECKQRHLEPEQPVYFTREELASVIAIADKIQKLLKNVEVKAWLFFSMPRKGKRSLRTWIDLSGDFRSIKIWYDPLSDKLRVVKK